MADEAEINFLAKEPVEVAQSPISTTAPSSSSSCTHPMAKPPAKRNVGDLTLLSILLMGENGKKAMEALREADKRVGLYRPYEGKVEAVLSNGQYSVVWESGEEEVLSRAEIEDLASTNPNVNAPPEATAAPATTNTTTTTSTTVALPPSLFSFPTTINPALRAESRLPHRKDLKDATVWEVCTGQVPGVAVNEELKAFLLAALEEHKAREVKKSPIACMQPDATSGYYGVEFCEASHKWVAYVDLPDQKHVIGRYDTKETAALQYNAVADRLEGAHLNVVEGEKLAPTVTLSSNGGVKATSKLYGVYWDKSSGKWVAALRIPGGKRIKESSEDEVEAGKKYDAMVRAHGLTNKPLNFDLTPEELAAGRHQAKKSSIYTGVNWFKSKGLWRAIGWMDGKRTHLGLHDTEIEAARAYDKWAHPLGKNLNFPDDYKGQKVATLAYVRPAALPEEEARARAMSLSADRAAFEASRPFSSRSFTGEILAQELHDLQTNAASLKKIPTKRGPPKDRSLLPIVVRAKGKGSVKAKKKKSHLRNIESDDSSSSGSDIGSDSSSDSSSDGSSSDGDDNDKENKKEWSSSKATANKTNGPGDESSQEPSDYELLRLQNIARNQAMMEALGLDSGNKSSNRHKRSDKHSKKKSAKDKDASKESTTATKKAPAKNSKWACHMVQYSARICTYLNKEVDAFCGLCQTPWEPSLGAEPSSESTPSPKGLTCPPGFVLVPTGRTSIINGVAREEFCLERKADTVLHGSSKHPAAAAAAPAVVEKQSQPAEVPLTIEELDVDFDEIDGFEIKASNFEWT